MMRRLLTVLVLTVVAAMLPGTGPFRLDASPQKEESLAIVVNQSNPVDDLSSRELHAMFLGERSHWSNGRRITLVMMEPGQPERDAVLSEICRMSESDLHRRLVQGLLTGEILVSPKTLSSPEGVRKFVFNVPGAIGYLRISDVDETVKVLKIDGHGPKDPQYTLKVPEVAR